MSQTMIRKALIKAITSVTLGVKLNLPNTPAKTGPEEASGDVAIVWNTPEAYTLGDNGEDLHTGFMQVLLKFPIGGGDLPTLVASDILRDNFKAGRRKWYLTQEVVISRCGVGQSEQLDGKYVTPVTIYWYAKTGR